CAREDGTGDSFDFW
nr:immunoglobulin heavy chain junction region [Mus musculus]